MHGCAYAWISALSTIASRNLPDNVRIISVEGRALNR